MHLERIAALVRGPVETLTLADCGHAPHREQRAAVLASIAAFVTRPEIAGG